VRRSPGERKSQSVRNNRLLIRKVNARLVQIIVNELEKAVSQSGEDERKAVARVDSKHRHWSGW
jgi:hypothetical protein